MDDPVVHRKRQFIDRLKEGDAVDDVYVLSERVIARKKDGEPFLTVTLCDRTGRIRGVVWDRAEEVARSVAAAEYVTVKGSVSLYQGKPQMVIRSLVLCGGEEVDPAEFIPATARNVDAMFDRLVKLAGDAVTNPHLKRLLSAFWDDPEFVRRFKTAPAAKQMHHNYLGGLLEHTLSMSILVDRLAGHYSGIDMDLLLTGAILHDIGKTVEFDYGSRIDYSDQGRLLSHIIIGCGMIEEKIRTLSGFPEELAMLVKHMVVSHHGQRDFGSPEPPKTIEAVLLNYIDEIDAKVNGIRDFMATDEPKGPWTGFHRMLGRQFFRGKGAGGGTDE